MHLRPAQLAMVLRYTNINTLDLADDQLNCYYGDDGNVRATLFIVKRL